MATKTRAKAKRRKTTVTKGARRRKTVRKTKIIRKKAAKKAPPRRAARTEAEPTAKVAVKPRPVSQRAQPEAVKPPPSRPAQPTAAEQRIGVVTHYYSHLSVVGMQLEPGTTLRVGDVITSADTPPISPRRSNPSRLIMRRWPRSGRTTILD